VVAQEGHDGGGDAADADLQRGAIENALDDERGDVVGVGAQAEVAVAVGRSCSACI